MTQPLSNTNLPLANGLGHATSSTITKARDPQATGSEEQPFKTSISEQPITQERKPFIPPTGSGLINAGTARATLAASREKPNGTTEDNYAGRHEHQTVVQQHVDYWDEDHDGIIWPQDTYIGCRRWGWSPPLAGFTAYIIHFALSYPTIPGLLPDPFFRIYLDHLYKDKHGSDSMTYDNEGRFKPQNFEDIFAKYDVGQKGGLDWRDVFQMLKGQRMVFDLFGWSAAALECESLHVYPSVNTESGYRFDPISNSTNVLVGLATYLLIWPEDGVMRKEDIRGIYDGSIFYKKAAQYEDKRKREHQKSLSTAPRLRSMAKILHLSN